MCDFTQFVWIEVNMVGFFSYHSNDFSQRNFLLSAFFSYGLQNSNLDFETKVNKYGEHNKANHFVSIII